MANFSNSVLAAAIVKAQQGFQKLENRDSEYGGMKAFLSNTQDFDIIQRLATARQRPSSYRMNTFTKSTGLGSLTCSPTATAGDSADTSLTWQTITGEMQISHKRQSENLYTTEEQAVIDLKNMWGGVAQNLEEAAMSYLNTNRSQNDISEGLSTWNGATDYYNSIALANKDRMRTIIRSEMRKAKYTDKLNIVHTAPYDEFFENTEIQGAGNARNYQDQDKKFNYFYTNEDITLASTYGGMFVVPMNGVAMLMWIDNLYREGASTGSKEWGNIVDPIFGLPFGFLVDKDCADTTAINGAKQDLAESMQVHIEVAFTHAAVTSPANETPIHKYALATS